VSGGIRVFITYDQSRRTNVTAARRSHADSACAERYLQPTPSPPTDISLRTRIASRLSRIRPRRLSASAHNEPGVSRAGHPPHGQWRRQGLIRRSFSDTVPVPLIFVAVSVMDADSGMCAASAVAAALGMVTVSDWVRPALSDARVRGIRTVLT
jgi:hypothetical protein